MINIPLCVKQACIQPYQHIIHPILLLCRLLHIHDFTTSKSDMAEIYYALSSSAVPTLAFSILLLIAN